MKSGLDRNDSAQPGGPTNVVSLANARKRAKDDAAAKRSSGTRRADSDGAARISLGQWIVGGLFMLMAIGGAVALVSPLIKRAEITAGLGIG